jgi:hypothetical protein
MALERPDAVEITRCRQVFRFLATTRPTRRYAEEITQ